MGTLTVLDPVAAPGHIAHISTLAINDLAGRHIAVLDNTKPNAVEIMERAAQILVSDHGAASYRVFRKLSASQGASEQLIEEIVSDYDVVITGSGDCGGCTSWSALDAAEIERRGTVAVLMVTDAFMPLASMLVEQEGAGDMRIAQIPHPIGGKPTDQVLPIGEAMAPDVVQLLKRGASSSDQSQPALASVREAVSS